MKTSARIVLLVAIAVHVLFLASLIDPNHFLNPLFPEGMHNLGEGQGSDFYAFYQAGRYVLDGENIYTRPMDDPDRVVPYAYFYRYLPFVAYTIGVAANAVPPRVAYWIWVVMVELVLLLCIRGTRSIVKDPTLFGYLTAMWLMYTPFYMEQYMGQLTFVMAAMSFAFVVLHLRGRTLAADGWWWASVVIKHLTVLYVPILVRLKKYRTVAIAVLLLLVTTVPYFLLRRHGTGDFTHDNFSINLHPYASNMGALAFFMVLKERFFPMASQAFAHLGPVKLSVTRVGAALVMGVPVLVSLWATFRRRPFDLLESFALWTMVYFFFFREVWEYHYVLLIPVFVLLYARTRARVLWFIYALAAAPTLFVFYDVPGGDVREAWLAWSAFEHVVNHAWKLVPLVWLFVWVAAGYQRRHAKLMESRMDTGVDLVF
jgi:hypothetical protein